MGTIKNTKVMTKKDLLAEIDRLKEQLEHYENIYGKKNLELPEQNTANQYKSKEILQLLFDGNNQAIILFNQNFEVMICNATAKNWVAQILEVEIKQGDSARIIFKNFAIEKFEQNFKKALAGENIVQESKIFHKGQPYWFQSHLKTVKTQNEKILGVSLIAQDITNTKLADEALKESQKRLMNAQRIALIGDFTWDLETLESSWSDTLFEIFKFDKEENITIDRLNSGIHHPDDVEKIAKWLKSSIESESNQLPPFEYRIFRKDGELRYVRTTGKIERLSRQSAKINWHCSGYYRPKACRRRIGNYF